LTRIGAVRETIICMHLHANVVKDYLKSIGARLTLSSLSRIYDKTEAILRTDFNFNYSIFS